MRLTSKEREAIVTQARRIFGDAACITLFGSRVDDNRRGGDIDLLVHADGDLHAAFRRKVQFLVEVKSRIGEQHIDVVVALPDDPRPIVAEANRTGVEL